MTDRLVRLAGRGLRADGAEVTWTIADGRRGRRWREAVMWDGALVHSLLYETGVDRRFTHLELAAPLGLVTLHPESDGVLHGNIVRADGVEHINGLAFTPSDGVLVVGSPIAAAAIAWASERLDGAVAAWVVELDPVRLTLHRSEAAPAVGSDAADGDGLPRLLASATWPLERGEAD